MPIDSKTTETILNADLANILKKVKAGKPLTKEERERITSAQIDEPVGLTDFESMAITESQLQLISDLTDRRHRQMSQADEIPKKVNGKWPMVETVRAMIAYYRTAAERAQDGLRIEQEAYTKAKRELAEEELKAYRGEKIDWQKVSVALRNAHTNMRAALQLKLESEIGPKLPMLKPEDQMNEIRKAVDDICDIFSNNLGKWYQAPKH